MKTKNYSFCNFIGSIFLVIFMLPAFAQEVVNDSKTTSDLPFTIRKGLELTYEVTINKSDYESLTFDKKPDYNFIVKFTEVSPTRVSFDWRMTQPINYSGKITMLEKALKEATVLYNYFQDQSNELLTDQTSVLLSKRVFTYMLITDKLQLDFGKGLVTLTKASVSLPGYLMDVNNRAVFLPKEDDYEFENTTENLRIEFAKIEDYNLILFMRTYEFSISLRKATF